MNWAHYSNGGPWTSTADVSVCEEVSVDTDKTHVETTKQFAEYTFPVQSNRTKTWEKKNNVTNLRLVEKFTSRFAQTL